MAEPWTQKRLDMALRLVNVKGLSLTSAAHELGITRKALTDAVIRHGYKIVFRTTITKA
jgi:predicted DNA-binding protein (UPF0251 family)